MAVVNKETIMSAPTPSTSTNNKRFYQSCDEEIAVIRDGRHEENTEKNTYSGLKVFRERLVERSLDVDFEVLTPEDLNKILIISEFVKK